MIVKYKYGFSYNDILYGWNEKYELFRLSQMIGKRFYPLKKLELIEWNKGVSKGYLVGTKRKSKLQLKAMTIFINHECQEIEDLKMPF